MKVAIVHNSVDDTSAPDERDVLVQVEAVSAALDLMGCEVETIPCDLNLEALKKNLAGMSPDVIFNLVESLDGKGSLIHLPPSIFDMAGLPYTGSPAEAIFITSHKVISKQWQRAAGMPTPDWFRRPEDIPNEQQLCGASPCGESYLVKSVWEHASFNMFDDGLIAGDSREEVYRRLGERLTETGPAFFAEKFIEGREFNISMLDGPEGPRVISPSEMTFVDFPPDMPKIVGYRAKWHEDSFEYKNTIRKFEFPASDEALLAELEDLALRCWKLFGLRGYARVDFRVDTGGGPWILEVNANPCLSPDAGFTAALERAGISYREAVECIIKSAI